MSSLEHGQTVVILLAVVIIFALGFLVYELAKPTVIPSFVLAIFFGMVSQDVLTFLTERPVSVTTLITIGAIFILFSGGLETPFRKFQELMAPIFSLAIIGTLINAMLLSGLVVSLAEAFGIHIPLIGAIVLGAALSSTDPAAIIPSFQSLLFTKNRVKHIAVSESAINDVVGAVLVSVFIMLFQNGVPFFSVLHTYANLFTLENTMLLLHVVVGGLVAGVLGFAVLLWWSRWKRRTQTEGETDAALFLAVPLGVFALASIAGGSGYLGVFITGLLFSLRSHMKHVEHYFNHTIEGFMKPMIFILLGALVEPAQLWEFAGIGIVTGLLFMFVLRPLIVLITMLPFCMTKKGFSISELIFLSFVRETGVIPAVLLITIQLLDIPGSEPIMAIGLWVILLTLIIEPPLTPCVACKLGVAKAAKERAQRKYSGPVAVLCSRGFSFPERMKAVVAWADDHQVENIALLHCPENKYSEEFVGDVKTRAEQLFESMNKKRENEGYKHINFEFLCGPGLLQDNIEAMVEEGDVSIIFVGQKMLDYRLEDVKRLDVPFFFM